MQKKAKFGVGGQSKRATPAFDELMGKLLAGMAAEIADQSTWDRWFGHLPPSQRAEQAEDLKPYLTFTPRIEDTPPSRKVTGK